MDSHFNNNRRNSILYETNQKSNQNKRMQKKKKRSWIIGAANLYVWKLFIFMIKMNSWLINRELRKLISSVKIKKKFLFFVLNENLRFKVPSVPFRLFQTSLYDFKISLWFLSYRLRHLFYYIHRILLTREGYFLKWFKRPLIRRSIS